MTSFKERLLRILSAKEAQDKYIDSIPSDIRDAIFDNTYSNEQGMLNDFLMKELFGDQLVEEVYWFLYDWKPGVTITTRTSSGSPIVHVINTIDDFVGFAVQHYKVQQ